MNKTIHSLLFVSLSAVATASAHAADTSRFFTGETSTTLSSGAASIDLEYSFISLGFESGIRAGALGGEIMLNSASDPHSGFFNSGIGYKKSIAKDLAAYGVISHYDDGTVGNSATNFALGAAYTMKTGGITLNINPELVTDDGGLNGRGNKSTLFIKGLAAYKLNNMPVSLVAEIVLDNNSFVERNINLGVRWQPKKNLTVDVVVYHDDGIPANDPITAIPGYIIINYLF